MGPLPWGTPIGPYAWEYMGDINETGNKDGEEMTMTSGGNKVLELMDTKDESKIFGRLSCVMRSPPLRERALSTGDMYRDSPDEGGKKRKVHDTSIEAERETRKRKENRTTAVVKDMLATICKYSQVLDKLVEENSNTKKEIKETVAKLKRITETVKKPSIQEWLEDKRWEVLPKQTGEVSVQTEHTEDIGKTSIGTQTYDTDDASGEEIATQLWDRIEMVEDYEGWEAILKEEWPMEAYRVTNIVEGKVKWSSIEDDLVLVLMAEDEGSGLARAASDACPIACALLKEGLEAGKAINGSLNTRVRNRDKEGEVMKGLRYTHIIPVSKDKLLQRKELFEGMKACNSTMTWAGRTGINLAVQEGVDIDMVRKTAEGVCREGIERIKIYPPPGAKKRENEGARRRGGNNKPPADRVRRERQTEAITVSQEGKSYSDMLRLVKEKVKTNSVAAQGIRTIRESREGKMIIVMERKEKEAIKKLKDELTSLQNVNLRVSGGKDIILLIKDMDGLTTKEEVEEAIYKELGRSEVDCKIGDLRPYYGGNQAVTIKMCKELAEVLIRKGRIKIGLTWCNVSEKVNVLQCYRCWQYGHTSAICKEGEDLTEACRKCGGLGHKAAQCQNGERCLSCKQEGHGAGSGKCPLFRQALRRARSNKKGRTRFSPLDTQAVI